MVRLSLLLKAGHTVEIIRRLAPQFEAEHGVGLDIEVVTEDDAYDRLASGRNLPDVCTVPYWYLAEMVDAGSLRALDRADYPGISHPLALHAMTYEGAIWGIPHTLTGGTLFTRLDTASGGMPADADSFEDFLDRWDTLIDHGSSVALRAGSAFSSAETYRGLLWAAGVAAFDGSGDLHLGDILDPLDALVDRLRRQKQSLTGLDYAQTGDVFTDGRASMMFDTSAWATFFALDESVSPLISYGHLGTVTPAPFFYAEGLGITSASAHPDAARELLRWRHSPPVISEEVSSLNRLDFPRSDVWSEPWFVDILQQGTNQHVFDHVQSSWSVIPAEYPLAGRGFVSWGRGLMTAIAEAIRGEELSVALARNLRA